MGTMGAGLSAAHRQASKRKLLLPHVTLKSSSKEPPKASGFGATTASTFQNIKKQMMDRIVSKSNLHANLKHRRGRPDGVKYGTLDPSEGTKAIERRSKSVVPTTTLDPDEGDGKDGKAKGPTRGNRAFLRPTPSLRDTAIKQLIGKYPVLVTKEAKDQNAEAKTGTLDLIRKVNDELFSGVTKRYCNFVDMGRLAEDYNIQQNLKTADILKELAASDTKTLKKAYNFRLVDMLEGQESAWEVTAEYKNGQSDPSRFAFAKMEKG